jgi:hypothetical protein
MKPVLQISLAAETRNNYTEFTKGFNNIKNEKECTVMDANMKKQM